MIREEEVKESSKLIKNILWLPNPDYKKICISLLSSNCHLDLHTTGRSLFPTGSPSAMKPDMSLMWDSFKSEIGQFSVILSPPTKNQWSGVGENQLTNHSAEWMRKWDEFEGQKLDDLFSLNFYYLPYTSTMIQFLRYCHLKVDQLLHIAIRLEFWPAVI